MKEVDLADKIVGVLLALGVDSDDIDVEVLTEIVLTKMKRRLAEKAALEDD
jgi:hypothetical protein